MAKPNLFYTKSSYQKKNIFFLLMSRFPLWCDFEDVTANLMIAHFVISKVRVVYGTLMIALLFFFHLKSSAMFTVNIDDCALCPSRKCVVFMVNIDDHRFAGFEFHIYPSHPRSLKLLVQQVRLDSFPCLFVYVVTASVCVFVLPTSLLPGTPLLI